jgi:hypothetical protein
VSSLSSFSRDVSDTMFLLIAGNVITTQFFFFFSRNIGFIALFAFV